MTDLDIDYAALLRGLIHQDFDGECHLTAEEAKAIADLITRLIRERAEWQDISTAPKDGTTIIAFHGGMVGVVRWAEKFAPLFGDRSPGWYSDILDGRVEPTLWQSMPAKPEEKP